MQDMAACKDKVQDIAACVCLGEGWKTVKKKKREKCVFSRPGELTFGGSIGLHSNVCVFLLAIKKIRQLFLCCNHQACVCVSVKVMKFNGEQAPPDVSQEEQLHNFSVTNHPTETGFRLILLFS